MLDRQIVNLDLNLLKVFAALYAHRSVTGAAEQLGLAQSSVSHALIRLRRALADPLFEKTTSGMQPTAFASRIAEPVDSALAAILHAVRHSRGFDPMTSDRTFNILTSDLGEFAFVPELVQLLAKRGPNLRVVVHQRPRGEYRQALENGDVDIAVGQMPMRHTDFIQRLLLKDRLSYAARKGNPIAEPLTMEALFEARHVVMQQGLIETHVCKALGKNASRRIIAATTNHYLTVPAILLGSDHISVLPNSLIRQWEGLKAMTPPFDIAQSEIRLFWHRRNNMDEGCDWLRRTIAELASFKAGKAFVSEPDAG